MGPRSIPRERIIGSPGGGAGLVVEPGEVDTEDRIQAVSGLQTAFHQFDGRRAPRPQGRPGLGDIGWKSCHAMCLRAHAAASAIVRSASGSLPAAKG